MSEQRPKPAGPSRAKRVEGAVWGLLVGDALGVPYEFHDAAEVPRFTEIDFTPPIGFPRAHASVEPGTFSDDGAQALCLLSSLLEKNRVDVDDFSQRLIDWYLKGYMAVDGRVFDVGITSARALRAIIDGAAPLAAAPSTVGDNGNGSLMRVLPLALWHRGTDAELVHDAMLQSRVTHGHLRAQLCCAYYCLWARAVFKHEETIASGWAAAQTALREIVRDNPAALVELDQHIVPTEAPLARGTGYVVDTLHSARHALLQHTYENVVRTAVMLGHDTDTTACVAGGLAGARDGIDAIPRRWREGLRGQALFMPLIERLKDAVG